MTSLLNPILILKTLRGMNLRAVQPRGVANLLSIIEGPPSSDPEKTFPFSTSVQTPSLLRHESLKVSIYPGSSEGQP